MKPMITAHSGCSGTPANSMEYIEKACTFPIAALEIDIRRHPGGELLLTHDPIADAPLVRLEDAFDYLRGKDIRINCDLKEYGLEAEILRAAERTGIARDRIIFTGSVTQARTFLKDCKDVCVMINPEELLPSFYADIRSDKAPTMQALLDVCRECGYRVINIDFRVMDEELYAMCADAGIAVSAWTADKGEDIRQLCEKQVLNITTNDPELALEIIS